MDVYLKKNHFSEKIFYYSISHIASLTLSQHYTILPVYYILTLFKIKINKYKIKSTLYTHMDTPTYM